MTFGFLPRFFARLRGLAGVEAEMRSPSAPRSETVAPSGRSARLLELTTLLLLQRKWSYMRYVHLREGLLAAGPVESVLAIGAGRGLAELALAVEFPKTRFCITDVASDRTPNYQLARERAQAWKMPNVEFGILDVTRPIPGRYDLVASVEVIEHIEDDGAAIAHMCEAARRFVFCLVPYADEATLADPRKQRRAWVRHQHYRFGYSPERLHGLFEEVVTMRGCYFRDAGHALRLTVDALDDDAIRERSGEFEAAARADVADVLPTPAAGPDEAPPAQGIWALARPLVRAESRTRRQRTPAPEEASAEAEALESRLREVRRRLVFYRSWNYLRYLHLRQAILSIQGVNSVFSMGTGRGLAELALAIEFPDVHFVTSSASSGPSTIGDQAMELARLWGIVNLSRATHEPGRPFPDCYDLVAAVETLENVEDDGALAAAMRAAAKRGVFCLVPFAGAPKAGEPRTSSPEKRRSSGQRFGYDAAALRRLFPGQPSMVRGCYWADAGARIVAAARDLPDDELLARAPILWKDSENDLIDRVPESVAEAGGIWILSPTGPATRS